MAHLVASILHACNVLVTKIWHLQLFVGWNGTELLRNHYMRDDHYNCYVSLKIVAIPPFFTFDNIAFTYSVVFPACLISSLQNNKIY